MEGRHRYNDAEAAGLVARYHKTGDPQARAALVEQMRPLVRSVARRFAGREPLEDLEGEGFVGLLRAIDRFQPERGARFSTFAMHLVAGQIRHYLRDRGYLIRQPAWLQELDHRVRQTTADLRQRLQREPTSAEIAEATNLTEEGVEELLAARRAARIVHLDTAAPDDEYLEVDTEKIRSRAYVTLQLPIEDRIVLENSINRLKELERKVVYYFFYRDFNQSEIARALGISCNYAGYVLRNGLKHLREGLPKSSPPRTDAGDESVIDPVTGLYTAGYLRGRLCEELSRAQGTGEPAAVACLQLPAECAESVLVEAAAILRGHTRKVDVLARSGPRELTVIFPRTGGAAARVANSLAERIESLLTVRVETGTAIFPDQARSPETLLAAARTAAWTAAPRASHPAAAAVV